MNAPAMQSTAHAAQGSGAALIQEFSLVLYLGCAVIFLLVMGLLLKAVFGRPVAVDARRWLLGGGLLFPGLTLGALLVYSLAVGATLADMGSSGPLRFLLDCVSSTARSIKASVAGGAEPPLRIQIIARQWWWEVRYVHPQRITEWVVLANELHLPAGRPAEITLHAPDVIHSFWVPSLAGKVDMIPGRANRLTVRAEEVGVYRGQCAEYCGGQHALMALYVEVRPPVEFAQWLAGQARPAALPEDPLLRAGHDAFQRAGCATCHVVRGTGAAGTGGPDLTHVGSRRSLGAGVLRNHVGTLAGWVADSQGIKRGNLMPPTRNLRGEELRAVAAWLESLK